MRRIAERLTRHARDLRNNGTRAERSLWRLLARYRPRFTRQLVVGPYIVDLACRAAKLAIELDGDQHALAAAYDARRTAFLEREGWVVVRYWNSDVAASAEGVADAILRLVDSRVVTHPCSSLPGRGGRAVLGREPPLPAREGRLSKAERGWVASNASRCRRSNLLSYNNPSGS